MSEDSFRKEKYEVTEMPGRISNLSLQPPAEDWRMGRKVLFTCTKDSANYFCRGRISSCERLFLLLDCVVFGFILIACSVHLHGIKNFPTNQSRQ